MTPGESVYGEKRISIATTNADGEEEKVEYRVWNPFRSKLAAGILGGLDNIHVSRTFFFLLFFFFGIPSCFVLTPYTSRSNPEPRSFTSVPPLAHPSPTSLTLSAPTVSSTPSSSLTVLVES